MANRKSIRTKDLIYPSRILDNLVNDYINGALDDYNFLFRALVVEIDTIGGQLSDEGEFKNPPNSIKARILTKDRNRDKENLRVFWPLFPYDVMPIKEGEHVYVIFENNQDEDGGLWISRIPEPNDINNLNFTEGKKKYENSPKTSSVGIDGTVQDVEVEADNVTRNENFVVEDVPRYKFRVGDRIIEGSNNTIIVLGRDRVSDVDSGEKENAGSVDIIVGRQGEDLNLLDDKSRIYVSSNTDADTNFEVNSGTPAGPGAYVVVKSDEIRVIGRSGIKIIVEGGSARISAPEIVFESNDIKIGGDDASEPLVLGNRFIQAFTAFLTALPAANPALAGPAGKLQTELVNMISAKHKSE